MKTTTSLKFLKIFILIGAFDVIQCQVGPYKRRPAFKSVTPSVLPDEDNLPLYTDDPEGGNNIFEWELSKKVMQTNKGSNTIISPVSIKVLLSLLCEGAGGSTLKELTDLLHLPVDRHDARERTQQLLQSFKDADKSEIDLMLSTRLFMDSHFEPIQRFGAIAMDFYDTQVQVLELLSNPSLSAGVINDWIKNGTKSRITNFITEEDVSTAVLLLMNTIYFKGKWRNQFLTNQTFDGEFDLNDKERVPAQFMSNTGVYYYHESNDLNAKILRIPYQGRRFAMYLFLPNSKNGLQELISQLSANVFKNILWVMNQVKVKVVIPKISYEFTARLGSILEELGLHNLFRETVSLPGIARGQNGGIASLYVSNVLQKSGIEINEEGSTAYTVSAITLGNKFNSVDYVFNASQPFLFSIVDESNSNILYFGKIENPLQKQGQSKNNPGWPNLVKPAVPNNVAPVADRINPQAPLQGQVEDESFLNVQTPFAITDQQLMDRVNYFDIEILQAMCLSRTGNVLVSPISIKSVLSMILEGANGQTAYELQSALRLSDNLETRRAYMKNIISKIKKHAEEGVQINIANGVFHSSAITPLPRYQDIIKTFYLSELKSVNFHDAQLASNTINKWIKEQTKGVIDQILNPQAIHPDTLITIINGVYFNGTWQKEFSPRDTVFRCFYVTENQCENVKMMHLSDVFKYADIPSLDAQAVDISYKDNKYAMLVVVPNKRNGIDQLVRDLPHTPLSNIYNLLADMEVQISLPKFKVEFIQDIIPDLRMLNINKLFSYQAELQGITGTPTSVKVDSVVHKVVVDVNEHGSVAAASSSAMIIPLISSSNPHVRADHPFLIFIHDTEQGNVLFSGRISNPSL